MMSSFTVEMLSCFFKYFSITEMFLRPDSLPVVADDGVVIGAAAAIEQHAAHREKQLPVRTHDGHWGRV